MRKLLFLCGAVLCLSLTAVAQDAPAALDASTPASEPAAPAALSPSNRKPWQLGIGYQYQHYNVLGQTFHDHGFNTDITRYLNDWFGVEGAVAMGWGNLGTSPIPIAPCNCAKSLFVGGGPHVAVYNHRRFEPWAHALVGWQHFRFTQTAGLLGSNSAFGFMAGGGVDYKLGAGVYWRIQGDYIGTHFQSTMQTNYSFGSGLVLNF
jgi:opacity protein-like surface antigen